MGVIRSTESVGAEVEELRSLLLLGGGGGTAAAAGRGRGGGAAAAGRKGAAAAEERGGTVCVTSGVSFLGFALARRLFDRGYAVRLALHTQEDVDKVREMNLLMETERDGVWAVVANLMDLDSLSQAFSGCIAVFHTSAFADPAGVSGYTKHMAEMEAKVAERVVEACARTPSVTKCVFTSSLLACIWRRNSPLNRRLSIDENCWSDESLCRDKKLWFALGKTMAEKAAWRAARGRDLKLVTLCPALLTGPGFCRRNSTASIAYLKGYQEMFADSLLATVDVGKVADAHVCIYEEMGSTACGRYICFDRIITRDGEAIELEQQLRLQSRISNRTSSSERSNLLELSNRKLSRLISTSRRCSYDIYTVLSP